MIALWTSEGANEELVLFLVLDPDKDILLKETLKV